MDAVKNFGIVELSTGYDATATSIELKPGEGAKLPDPVVDGQYNLVWYDHSTYSSPAADPNVEIVRVTGPAGTGDTKTITRAQEGTSASSKTNGGTMVLGTTAKILTDIDTEKAAIDRKLDDFGTPDDNTDLDATAAQHGLLLKLNSNTDHFLRGDGSWAAPPGAGGGEANTASNQGVGGVGPYYQKSGLDLQFKNINAGSNKVSITDDAANHEIDIDVNESNIKLDNLGTPDDNTDLDATILLHGLLSKIDKTKLAGIEDGATADQTGAEIKTAYEAEPNAYTDTKDTKLAGIEDGATADQIASEVPNTPAGGIVATDIQAAINELDTEKQFKVDQNHIYYVGKHGHDLNSGKNIESAFLTFGAAISEANSQHPTATNKYVIKCNDAGIYAENLTIPSYIAIYGPYCEINGNIIVNDRSAFQVFSGYCETGIYISKTTGSSHATIIIRRIELGKSATALSCATGELNVNCSIIILENGIGIDSQSHEGININLRHIDITGTGTALRQAGGTINITCETISDSGGHGMGIYLSSGGIINGQIGDINCNVAYNINTSSVLNLLCSSISGTRTNTATANVITTDGNSFIGGNLDLSGTVDGRDVSTDGTKLDGIEAGATADQIASEVPNTPAGGIVATDVQAAINELDTEKAAIDRKLDDFGTPDDNTDLDASITRHGLLKKLGGGTDNFLRADGSWAAPPGGGGSQKVNLFLPAEAAYLPETNPPLLSEILGATVYGGYSTLNFDDATGEHAIWRIPVPGYDGGNMTITLRWIATAIIGDVIWAIKSIGLTENEEFISAVVSNTTQLPPDTVAGTSNYLNKTIISTYNPNLPAIEADDLMVIQISRYTGIGDTLIGDAKLLSVEIEYTRS